MSVSEFSEIYINSSPGCLICRLPVPYFHPISVKYRVSTLAALCAKAMLRLELVGDVTPLSTFSYYREKIAELHSLRKFRDFFYSFLISQTFTNGLMV